MNIFWFFDKVSELELVGEGLGEINMASRSIPPTVSARVGTHDSVDSVIMDTKRILPEHQCQDAMKHVLLPYKGHCHSTQNGHPLLPF